MFRSLYNLLAGVEPGKPRSLYERCLIRTASESQSELFIKTGHDRARVQAMVLDHVRDRLVISDWHERCLFVFSTKDGSVIGKYDAQRVGYPNAALFDRVGYRSAKLLSGLGLPNPRIGIAQFKPCVMALDSTGDFIIMSCGYKLPYYDILSAEDYRWIGRVMLPWSLQEELRRYTRDMLYRNLLAVTMPLIFEPDANGSMHPIPWASSPLAKWVSMNHIAGYDTYMHWPDTPKDIQDVGLDVSLCRGWEEMIAIDHMRDLAFIKSNCINDVTADGSESSTLFTIRVARLSTGRHVRNLCLPRNGRFEFKNREGIRGACVDNRGRLILLCYYDEDVFLHAFSHSGLYLGELALPRSRPLFFPRDEVHFEGEPSTLVYDRRRGWIAFEVDRCHLLMDLNEWLPGSFIWQPAYHHYAPKSVKDLVYASTCIRSLALHSSLSLLPNELLFEIFAHV